MSYTLRGRLESRLAAMLVPLASAGLLSIVVAEWWPIELAVLMLAVGVVLDVAVYHPLLAYQPGWAALPLGLLELALVMALVRALAVAAPLGPGLALFALSWAWAQAMGHAALPLLRFSYAEDGGELARAGPAVAAGAGAIVLAALTVAWVQLPPTVHLEAGVHRGPLVIVSAQHLVGEPGTIVRGGIRILADDVVVRDVEVVGGLNGIEVEHAENVLLDGVRVSGAKLDGIHVRRSEVRIEDCRVDSPPGYTQGIDISFAADLEMSAVEGCAISGGQEGIVTHSAHVVIEDNTVRETSLRAITMTEMSMGAIEGNTVLDALGVGIFCGDYSMCEVHGNYVAGTRPDEASADATRMGVGVEAHYGATVELGRNELGGNPAGTASFADATIVGR